MIKKPQHPQIKCREAVESSLKVLIAHYENARCDSEAVSECVRCNAVFLAKSVSEMLVDASSAAGDADK